MLDQINDLTATEVTLKGENNAETTFTFETMFALKAWPIALEIRAEIGKVASPETYETLFNALGGGPNETNIGRGKKVVISLLQIVLTLPTAFLMQLQNSLFEHVYYSNQSTGHTKQLVRNVEDAAFEGLDAFCVGEVLVRSLAVNFTSSFQRIASLIFDPLPPSTSPSPPSE